MLLAFATFLLLLCLLEVVEEGIDVVVLLYQLEGEINEPTYHYDGSCVDYNCVEEQRVHFLHRKGLHRGIY